MRTIALAVLLLVVSSVQAATTASQAWTLTRAEWAGPLNAQRVVALAPVRSAVNALAAVQGSRLLVLHNGGEEGLFRASDLEGWLIALGVPGASIVDRSGAVPGNEIRLKLLPASVVSKP